MSKFRVRKLVLSITLALSALMATSGLAMAGTGTLVIQNVWGSAGAFGAYANFSAQWVASQRTVGTTQTWTIWNMQLSALIKTGRGCNPLYCSGWGLTTVAKFYDWHNNLVSTVNLPTGSCYASATNPNDLLLSNCRAGSFTFSVNKPTILVSSKMTLSWSVGMLVIGGAFFANAWHTTKSMTLNQT